MTKDWIEVNNDEVKRLILRGGPDGLGIKELLIDTYNKHQNMRDAAMEMDISTTTFCDWCKRNGLEIRCELVEKDA